MKKGLKKQIESELTDAIKKTLFSHNTRAISKTKKTIKEASKSVAKKFVKTLKTLAEKRKSADNARKKLTSKARPKKSVASGKVKSRKVVSISPANSSKKNGKNKLALTNTLKAKAFTPMNTPEHN